MKADGPARAEAQVMRTAHAFLFVSLGFALATGAALGLIGLRTSGFVFTLTPRLSLWLVCLALAAYLLIGVVALAISGPARRRRPGLVDRALFAAMATVTLWSVLTLTFLPLKGSESFVRANTLSTVRLNVIGLVVVLAVGLVAGWLLSLAYGAVMRILRRRLSVGRRRLLGTACALAAVVAMFVGGLTGRASEGTHWRVEVGDIVTARTPRVAIVGVDGCDWEKLGPLVDAGKLPTFRRLMDGGVYGDLTSIPPLVSPRIWTTIATGKVAEKHGIYDFINAAGVPVNATMRTALPIWDIVSEGGGTAGIVGWYVTWPADQVNGFLVSDRFHSLVRGPVQAFQSATGRPTNTRLETFGDFTFDPAYKRYAEDDLRYQQNMIVDEPLRWGYLRDAIYTRVAQTFLPTYRPTLAAVYLRGVDFVQHFFWKYSDPEPFGDVTPEDMETYGEVIDNYYIYTDTLLSRLLKALGPDVNILLVSDHGFQARTDLDPKRPQLTGAHDIEGVFIASGPAFVKAGRYDGATILDITPTALAVMGFPRADDMDGRVLTEIIEPRFLTDRTATSVSTYDPEGMSGRAEVGSSMDESIKEQLKSLGYIE
ncbi:MAG: alkaline phosphatase family protein [Candidatus Eisenbacteria bacterium]|nr:alkaline phosphatase family protein [Candidatus Eisenbacteria bacterium]